MKKIYIPFLLFFVAPFSLWGAVSSNLIEIHEAIKNRQEIKISVTDKKYNLTLTPTIELDTSKNTIGGWILVQKNLKGLPPLKAIKAKIMLFAKPSNVSNLLYTTSVTIAPKDFGEEDWIEDNLPTEKAKFSILDKVHSAKIELTCIPNGASVDQNSDSSLDNDNAKKKSLWSKIKAIYKEKPKLSISLSVLFTALTALGIGGSYKLYKKKKKQKLAAKKKEEEVEEEAPMGKIK